ncbi:hypothetical protein KSP39_PZI016209 [Platanthera zijinensis]|uniref:Uncharacterized protein n=1 Tax=Platanthera zijinensis TaxID=2320716 RepID=A0AAP0B7F8_9ASPA
MKAILKALWRKCRCTGPDSAFQSKASGRNCPWLSRIFPTKSDVKTLCDAFEERRPWKSGMGRQQIQIHSRLPSSERKTFPCTNTENARSIPKPQLHAILDRQSFLEQLILYLQSSFLVLDEGRESFSLRIVCVEIGWVFSLPRSSYRKSCALDGCPGIEKEGRFQRRKAMGRESVCDPWISDRETVSKLRG